MWHVNVRVRVHVTMQPSAGACVSALTCVALLHWAVAELRRGDHIGRYVAMLPDFAVAAFGAVGVGWPGVDGRWRWDADLTQN